MKKKQILSVIAVIAVLCAGIYGLFNGYNDTSQLSNLKAPENGTSVVVNFIDVGQGDSGFIQLPDGKCMLIDAGEAEYADTVIDKIRSLGYSKIDYLVATHPHIDHIGGMKGVIEAFKIGEIFMPKASADTKTYERLLQAISDKGLSVTAAKAGKLIYSDESLCIKFIAPVSDTYDELNNYSAVVRLEYGATSFLFMGDAEELAEKEMLETYSKSELKADVLKVGHHGSKYSSCASFLRAVNPDYAVIEVGKDNPYDHPHIDAVRRLKLIGARILRTDEMGDIAITSDGSTLTVNQYMKFIIDRFEGSFALCETEEGKTVDVPKVVLPPRAKEGDVISVTIDKEETQKRKDKIEGLMNSLFKD